MDHTVYQSTITPLSSIINDVTDTFYINLRKMIGPARLSPGCVPPFTHVVAQSFEGLSL